jgi:hypothetical protein
MLSGYFSFLQLTVHLKIKIKCYLLIKYRTNERTGLHWLHRNRQLCVGGDAHLTFLKNIILILDQKNLQ